MRPLRYLDVCSGYSACTIGWTGFPLECVGYAEIDPAPAAVLSHRWGAGRPRMMPQPDAVEFPAGLDPLDRDFFKAARERMKHNAQSLDEQQFIAAWKERETRRTNINALAKISWADRLPNYGDFTTIGDESDVGSIDLLIGGTPCQGFSIAGRRLGLADPRGHLTLEFLALARRLRPRWLVWENVPNFLSIDDGEAMGTFLGLLGELGYGWAYRMLDSQYVRVDGFEGAVPQRRRRLFVVGYLGAGAPARAVLFEPGSLRGRPAPRREAGQNVAGTLAARAGGGGFPDGGDGRHSHLIAHTLRAEGFDATEDGSGRGTPIIPVVAGTIEAAAGKSRGAGTAPGILMPVVSLTLRAGGNRTGGDRPPGSDVDTIETLVPISVAAPLRAGGSSNGNHPPGTDNDSAENLVPIHCPPICPQAISSKWAKGSSGPAGDEIANLIAFSIKDHGNDALDDLAPTLRSMGHDGSHANGGGQIAEAFDTTQITHPENRSNPQPGDPCHSIPQSGHAPSIALAFNARQDPDISGPITHPLDTDGSSNGVMIGHNSGGYRVRRLTPRECERLQGCPDDFTLVPYQRGKLMADGPRYKMIGNSQSGNVMRWLGHGIAAVEAELRAAGLAE